MATGIQLLGQGTTLKYTGSGVAIDLDGAHHCCIEKLNIVGTASAAIGIKIHGGSQETYIHDVKIEGFETGRGIFVTADTAWIGYSLIDKCRIQNCKEAIYFYGAAYAVNANTIRDCRLSSDLDDSSLIVFGYNTGSVAGNRIIRGTYEMSGSNTIGLLIKGGRNFIEDPWIEGPSTGIKLDHSGDAFVLRPCIYNVGTGIEITSSSDSRIVGAYFSNVTTPISDNGIRTRINGIGQIAGVPTASDWDPGDLIIDTSNNRLYIVEHDGSTLKYVSLT